MCVESILFKLGIWKCRGQPATEKGSVCTENYREYGSINFMTSLPLYRSRSFASTKWRLRDKSIMLWASSLSLEILYVRYVFKSAVSTWISYSWPAAHPPKMAPHVEESIVCTLGIGKCYAHVNLLFFCQPATENCTLGIKVPAREFIFCQPATENYSVHC